MGMRNYCMKISPLINLTTEKYIVIRVKKSLIYLGFFPFHIMMLLDKLRLIF